MAVEPWHSMRLKAEEEMHMGSALLLSFCSKT